MKQTYYSRFTEECQKSVYERRDAIKKWHKSLKIGKKCKNCKILCDDKNSEKFHFHHRNPAKKLFSISDGVTRGFAIKTIKKELEKTTFLCEKCHER